MWEWRRWTPGFSFILTNCFLSSFNLHILWVHTPVMHRTSLHRQQWVPHSQSTTSTAPGFWVLTLQPQKCAVHTWEKDGKGRIWKKKMCPKYIQQTSKSALKVPEYFASTWYIDLTLNKIQLLGSSQRFGPDINDRVSIHTHSVHHKSATGSDPRAFLFWKQRDMRREGRGGEWCVIEYVYIRSIHIRYIMEINQAKT